MTTDLFAWEKAIREDRTLSSKAKLLALLLRTYLNCNTAEWSVGITRLAAEMGNVHRETVKRARRELVEAGYLRVRPRTGRANTYRALLPSAPVHQGERTRALEGAHPCADTQRTHAPLTTQVNPSSNPSSYSSKKRPKKNSLPGPVTAKDFLASIAEVDDECLAAIERTYIEKTRAKLAKSEKQRRQAV